MSYADKVFIDMCRDIIDNGTSTEGEKVRPVWEDGTSAYTIKKFGVVNRYDLSKEFPALTYPTSLSGTSRCSTRNMPICTDDVHCAYHRGMPAHGNGIHRKSVWISDGRET